MVRYRALKPSISVLLPVHNGERFLAPALKSILSQTRVNFELIAVNDGSNDKTEKILGRIRDRRLRVINCPLQQGVAVALNLALSKAKGEFIARMDADDVAEKERFEKQIRYLETYPEVGVVGSWVKLIDGREKLKGYKKFPASDREIKQALHHANPLIHPSVMIRRKLFDKYGGYSPGLDGAEDYDLWCRFAPHTEFANLKQVLLQYRLHQDSVSFTRTSRLNFAYARVQLKKVLVYGYPAWELIFGLKSLLSLLMPGPIQRFVYKKLFGYQEA